MSTERATSELAAAYTVATVAPLVAACRHYRDIRGDTLPAAHPPQCLRRAGALSSPGAGLPRRGRHPGGRARDRRGRSRRLHSASVRAAHPFAVDVRKRLPRALRVRMYDGERSGRRSPSRPSRSTPQPSRARSWPRRTDPAPPASRPGRSRERSVAPRRWLLRTPIRQDDRDRRRRAGGLACAHDLALLGHRAIVFDTRAEPGGLMTGGIPAFRFPVASARAECAAVLTLDVEFRGGRAVESLSSLLANGADAVFLAIGASRPRRPPWNRHSSIPTSSMQWTCSRRHRSAGSDDRRRRGPTRHRRRADTRAALGDRGEAQRCVCDRSGGAHHAARRNGSVTPEMLAACAREGVIVHHEWRVRRVHVDTESGLLVSVDVAAPDGHRRRVLPCDRLVLAAARAPDDDDSCSRDRAHAVRVHRDGSHKRCERRCLTSGPAVPARLAIARSRTRSPTGSGPHGRYTPRSPGRA